MIVTFSEDVLPSVESYLLKLPKGRAKLENIVADANVSQFSRSGNIRVAETNFAARKTESVFDWSQKHFCFPDTNFASETYVSQFNHPGNITRNIVSATMCPSFARP